MRPTRLILAALLATGAASAQTCDRACLKTTLDQYLQAVIKHDPSAAPLFLGFRQTENAVVVKPGTGLWKTMTGLGKVQRKYYDAVQGQAAYLGLIDESASGAIVALRLRVENRKITEAEWIVDRKNDPGLNGLTPTGESSGNFYEPDTLALNPPPERVVPKAQRVSREELTAITNSYFDGLTTHDGSIIIAHPGCTRVENGRAMAGNVQTNNGVGPTSKGGPAKGGGGDCASGLAGLNTSIVSARRYPVIDDEAQVALAFAVFLRKPGTATRRNSFAELFAVDTGKIRAIWSMMHFPTAEIPVPNWPPYDGNFPVPAEFAPPAPAKGK
ncbi:MAG: hypothetical protein WDO18_21210 [Acidobacteriota bacterium]